MADQITLEEALQLVTFVKDSAGKWRAGHVLGNVLGSVQGDIDGNVGGHVGGVVRGDVFGDVRGDVEGTVLGTISGKKWTSIETPREKLSRLIKEKGDQELIEAFNQVEDSNG